MIVITNKALKDSLTARDKECACLLDIISALSTGRGANIGGGGGGGGDTDGNDRKKPWDPGGYFWSHEYKGRTGHSSTTCRNKHEGYDAHLNAKRGDTQGGYQCSLACKTKQSGNS